jgi:hypothetical protein
LPEQFPDFVPNFWQVMNLIWQVMNLKSKKQTIGKHIPQNSKKKRLLTSRMGGAIFNSKKEIPI